MNKNRRNLLIIGIIAFIGIVISFILWFNSDTPFQYEVMSSPSFKGKLITKATSDKSMYDPGDFVHVQVNLRNNMDVDLEQGKITFKVKHLEKQVGSIITHDINLEQKERLEIGETIEMPKEDFKGYMIEIGLWDASNELLDYETLGIDVSSTWTKFPRYGYVWNFGENVDVESRIETLKNYNINALQYYDWKYRHHKPIGDNTDVWDDWTGRKIYGDTLRKYISEAKKANMVNMAYNMIYAATNGYEEDGVKKEWAIYHAEGDLAGQHFNFQMTDSSPTGITHLFFFDPSNKEWQDYIFKQQKKVFETFEFDGWHGDTVGDWGKMRTHDGKTLYVTDTYTEFLNAAKEAIGDKFLSFNPVGAQGIENVNKSNVDVLYAEIWPWDTDRDGLKYDSYYSLKKQIDRSREESGGKSLVIPAYMNYGYGEENPGRFFNTASVLLTDAAVFAAGGSRIELGDNGSMLSNEYFPAENLFMSQELKDYIANYYDFIVAYENLLRDGQENTDNKIVFSDYRSSTLGIPDQIWAYSKQDDEYEIVQMINLLGVMDDKWRANDGEKEKPTHIENFEMKYYYSNDIQGVYFASPDLDGGQTKELSFTKGSDDDGDYILVEVPSLEYWSMIFMRYE